MAITQLHSEPESLSTFSVLRDYARCDDWRGIVVQLVGALLAQEPDPLIEIIDRVTALDARLGGELDDALIQRDPRPAILGFALARTWPDSIEEFGAWLETARDYADDRASGCTCGR